jgi:hypothetical protein
MNDLQWEVVEEVAGDGRAKILAGLLEAQGIPVLLSQEGVGSVYAVTVGKLGRVQILVPADSLEQARQVIEDYHLGAFEAKEPLEEIWDREGDDEEGDDA